MSRPLGTFETAATLTNDVAPFVVVVVLALDGGPSLERLRDALAVLQRRHPLLRVRIAERGGRFWYEPLGGPLPPIPLRVVERTTVERWREVAEEELNTRIGSEDGPLVRCTYVVRGSDPGDPRAKDRRELVLALHHAIMDGASGLTLVDQLLALCGPASDGDLQELAAEAPAAGAILPPVETLFPASTRGLGGRLGAARFLGRQLADEVAFRLRTRCGRRPPIAASARCHVLPVGLTREETAALVQATRRRRVTLNGALGAAFLCAVDDRLYGGSARALRYMTFADLRPYLDPPVPADELGSFLAMLRYTARMDGERPAGASGAAGGGERFWDLARHLTGQVVRGARRGDKLWAVRLSEAVMRRLLRRRSERMAATAVSYLGVARLGDAAGVRGLHAFVSNFALGPEYTALARIFDGELRLDVVYLDVDMDAALARELAEEIVDLLRRAGTPSAPSARSGRSAQLNRSDRSGRKGQA